MGLRPGDETEGIATVRRTHELGVNFFDTAQIYGMGTGSNERLLGEAVEEFRDEIVIATKPGFDLSNPQEGFGFPTDSRPETFRKAADDSLCHLGIDQIDVFYQHRVDPDVSIEDVAGPESIRMAHAVRPVSVLQAEYPCSNATGLGPQEGSHEAGLTPSRARSCTSPGGGKVQSRVSAASGRPGGGD